MTDSTNISDRLIRALLMLALLVALPAYARCPLQGQGAPALERWKASGFEPADPLRQGEQALQLVDCLGEVDPHIRDGIAFEALSTWMRGKQLDAAALRALQQRLQSQLMGEDAEGFRKPFAALVLSEVARTDRVQPWMTAEERGRVVNAAAAYLSSVRDYRGYEDGQGWRHGVAHGADWGLQLILNKAVEPAQAMTLLAAVGSQVMPSVGDAYAFGEPARLARPVAYGVARGDLAQSGINAWLDGLIAALGPRPQDEQQAAWWRRRANLEDFLHALAHLVDGDQSPALSATSLSVHATLEKLP